MAIMLSDIQIKHAITKTPALSDAKLKQAHAALSDILAEHDASALELELWLALDNEINKRGLL